MLRTHYKCLGSALTAVPGGVGARGVSSTASVLGSNKDWLAMKREHKARRDAEWRRRSRANPFRHNTGVGRKLKSLGVDPDDPAVETFSPMGPAMEDAAQMDELYDLTSKSNGAMGGGGPNVDPRMLPYILTKKRYVPDKEDPDLLTWLEKETIKHLHKVDPVEFSVERLAQGFPATERTLAKLVKSKYKIPPAKLRDHDRTVHENWRLLAKGELEITDALEKHLEDQGGTDGRMKGELPFHLEEEVIQNYVKSFEMPRVEPGRFGNIIVDYNRKVRAIEEQRRLEAAGPKGLKPGQRKDEVIVADNVPAADMFSDRSFDPQLNVPSAHRDTALIRSAVDLGRERRMTMDNFRRKFLRSVSRAKELVDASALAGSARESQRATFMQWLAKEKKKDSMVTAPKKLSADHVLEEEAGSADVFQVQKYQTDSPPPHMQSKSAWRGTNEATNAETTKDTTDDSAYFGEDTINIPSAKYRENAIYRKGDSFYNHRGKLLYRVPGETEYSAGRKT